MLWSALIDVVRGSLFVLAHWCGGSLGAAIFLATIAARLALMPLSLAAARRQLVRQRDKVKTPPDLRTMLDMFTQLPPAAVLYSAIRQATSRAAGFLWIRDLAKPDYVLALVAAAVSAALAWISAVAPVGKETQTLAPMIVSGVITFLILSHLSAGVAVYSVANSLMTIAERGIAARSLPRARA